MESIDNIVKQAIYPRLVEFWIIQTATNCLGDEIEFKVKYKQEDLEIIAN